MSRSELVSPAHLQRKALIYIRQSTPHQVLSNQESLRLQYALQQRAIDLGWRQEDIEVIDADLGMTGASASHRLGFQGLVARVTLGQVGIILSVDVTRLSRNCSDWYPLLDVCGYRSCLIADRDGIYDPGSANGRLLLGLKGSMSEAELHWLKSRLQGGKMTKAEQGQLRFRLPIGLVYDPVGRIVAELCWTRMRPCRKLFIWSFRFLSNRPRPSPWSVPSPGNTCVSRRGGGAASEPMN